MKTLVDIDEALLKEAMRLAESQTKKETIQRALAELIRTCRRRSLKALAGSGAVDMSLTELHRTRRSRHVTVPRPGRTVRMRRAR